MTAINAAVAAILSRRLPPRYHSRQNRWRTGKMGLASKIKLLEEFGYKVDVSVIPPETESPIFNYNPDLFRVGRIVKNRK